LASKKKRRAEAGPTPSTSGTLPVLGRPDPSSAPLVRPHDAPKPQDPVSGSGSKGGQGGRGRGGSSGSGPGSARASPAASPALDSSRAAGSGIRTPPKSPGGKGKKGDGKSGKGKNRPHSQSGGWHGKGGGWGWKGGSKW
jgi:hypothetical protein